MKSNHNKLMEGDRRTIIKVRAIILHQCKLLLVRHPGYDSNLAALPGGHLEWGEDIRECLGRELVEELGVEPKIGRLLYVNSFIETNNRYVEFFFEVKNGGDYLNTENLARSHSDEIVEIIWASPADDISILPKSLAEYFRTGRIIGDEIRYLKD